MGELTLVTDVRCTLGEGPIWYEGVLYWVDIVERRVHSYRPSTGRVQTMQLDSMVGTVVPRASGGLVVALETGFAFLDPETGAVTPITDPESDKPGNRFNDGKCDPRGRFWAGTMSYEEAPNRGALYMLDIDGRAHLKVTDVTTSNGIAWSLDEKTMYYIDTPTYRVDAFDFDPNTGAIANRRTVIEIPKEEGNPDGMTIDANGNLWIGLWGGSAVACYDPRTGEKLASIPVPASKVTACAFGGDDLKDLYITTARVGSETEPLAGRLFRIRLDVAGIPAFAYAG